jgi:hypothetical protein
MCLVGYLKRKGYVRLEEYWSCSLNVCFGVWNVIVS